MLEMIPIIREIPNFGKSSIFDFIQEDICSDFSKTSLRIHLDGAPQQVSRELFHARIEDYEHLPFVAHGRSL